MSAPYSNCIVYLYGYPGVGKRTIALEICKYKNFRLYDNHTINNVLFPFVRIDGTTPIPSAVWDSALKIRDIALDTMVQSGNRQFSYVFTNELMMNDSFDQELFESVKRSAQKMQARFLPVRIMCDPEENKKRIMNFDREYLMKATDPRLIDEFSLNEVFKSFDPNELEIDVTAIEAPYAAQQILSVLDGIHKF
jgi:hypothetical protein